MAAPALSARARCPDGVEALTSITRLLGWPLIRPLPAACTVGGMNLPQQHLAQLQFQLAMLTGHTPGGYPVMPPGMPLGAGNPFSALTPQQVSTAQCSL